MLNSNVKRVSLLKRCIFAVIKNGIKNHNLKLAINSDTMVVLKNAKK